MEGLRGAPELLLLVLLSLAGGSLSGPASRTVTVPEGGSVILICAVRKPPSVGQQLEWTVFKGDGISFVVSRQQDGQVSKGINDPQHRFSLLDDSSLRITNIQPGDAGQYRCNWQPAAVLQVTAGDSKITEAPGTGSPSPGDPKTAEAPSTESPSPGGSTSHTVHTSLVACGLTGLVSAVIATEIRSRRREASGTRTGETP
ncbi:tyrosine-protein phosphatase non-receptor type substrate 1-like isoform X2 [Lepisosteus oculatus]|uniref:tyrosine-protein phosphatase non-receptor type substrate 1-like isoform X2 n=1 Tax=Lepisosteus oculatus TaxID=7918 RepID=UPI0035F509DF